MEQQPEAQNTIVVFGGRPYVYVGTMKKFVPKFPQPGTPLEVQGYSTSFINEALQHGDATIQVPETTSFTMSFGDDGKLVEKPGVTHSFAESLTLQLFTGIQCENREAWRAGKSFSVTVKIESDGILSKEPSTHDLPFAIGDVVVFSDGRNKGLQMVIEDITAGAKCTYETPEGKFHVNVSLDMIQKVEED